MFKFNDKIDELIVTVGYIGKIKYAPGTFGSLVGLLILILPEYMIWYSALFLAFVFSILSYYSIQRYEKLKGFDNSSIVIDEVIGMLVVFSNPFMIINQIWVIIAFLLFRAFDIIKPYPISKLNNQTGAFFVIADDVIAGVFSLVILHILQLGYRILPFFMNYLKIF